MSPAAMSRTFITPVHYMTAEVRGKYARPQLFNTLYVSQNERTFTSPSSPPTKSISKRNSRSSSRPGSSTSTARYINVLENQVKRERSRRAEAEAKLDTIR
mmetsp:Transcript_7359/g.13652  ORF Transcript_7359/g.13652 Transcript_7359/m.13652 type:complete len:101 (+) Transcript_7359:395-697(+)